MRKPSHTDGGFYICHLCCMEQFSQQNVKAVQYINIQAHDDILHSAE